MFRHLGLCLFLLAKLPLPGLHLAGLPLAALPLVGLSGALAAEERVWTDTQGRTMRAQFLREADGDAVFLKEGKLVTVPLARFTAADQEAMKKLAVGQALPADQSPQDPFVTVRPAPPPPPSGFAQAPPLVQSKTEVVVRDWSDTAGNRTSGKFVRVNGPDVILLRGSRTLAVAFSKLSLVDQLYVNQILEERGQQPMVVPTPTPTGPNAGESEGPGPLDAPAQPRDAPAQPRDPARTKEVNPLSGESDELGRFAPANSRVFQKLRSRQEEAREAQAEFAATAPDLGEESAGGAEPASEPSEAVPAPLPPSVTTSRQERRSAPGGLLIKSETLAELRPVLLVGLVVGGLFGALGLIVYFATSVAASNSTRRQNRYL